MNYQLTYWLLVEGNHGGPYSHPDYLLFAIGCSPNCIGLAMCILGGFVKGMVSGVIVHIRLL